MGRFRGGNGVGLGIRGWRWVGLGICKVGGVGSGSNHTPWILWAAARRSSDRMRCKAKAHDSCAHTIRVK